jgi:hypothetical protein
MLIIITLTLVDIIRVYCIVILGGLKDMKYKRIKLDYKYKDLEPHIDEETMKVHYEKHHAGYEANLEKSIKDTDISK